MACAAVGPRPAHAAASGLKEHRCRDHFRAKVRNPSLRFFARERGSLPRLRRKSLRNAAGASAAAAAQSFRCSTLTHTNLLRTHSIPSIALLTAASAGVRPPALRSQVSLSGPLVKVYNNRAVEVLQAFFRAAAVREAAGGAARRVQQRLARRMRPRALRCAGARARPLAREAAWA